MESSRIALGKRIQKLRQRAGVTQAQLVEKADLSLKHLGELERGRGNPTLLSLESIASALDISLSDMFAFDHERLSPNEIREELRAIIDKATDENCSTFLRILKVLVR